MRLDEILQLAAAGESETLELKSSTAELSRVGETLCAMLNAAGGRVVIGVAPSGRIIGQQVSDKTLQEIAAMLDRFEPSARVALERITVGEGRDVLVLRAEDSRDRLPFAFRGRPYHRVGSSTTPMPQDQYARLLLDRGHARHRWENQPALGVQIDDLDHEEILRTRELAVQQRRISAGTSTEVGDILDRLGLRVNGQVTQAAQVLYGTDFLPHYPQALLKMGRFRGKSITGDILDNKHEHLHAFAMVREALAWLDRTLPLAAHFVEGRIEREDRLPVPPDALREVILNAVMHRDYSEPSGYVAIAVFDDRIEVWSIGRLPAGITVADLSGPHLSSRRNPLIADAFHRTGAVEVWGRGTNRVIEECVRYGLAPPSFEERSGALVVTFHAPIGSTAAPEIGEGPSRDQVGIKPGTSEDQVLVLERAREPQPLQELMRACGRASRPKFMDQVLRPLLDAGLLAMTVPDRPTSSRQRYRTTEAGARLLAEMLRR